MKPKILCIHGMGISGSVSQGKCQRQKMLSTDLNTRQWCSYFVSIFYLPQNLIDGCAGELEMNFGEYEFVYPDGEVDTIPTNGKIVEDLEPGRAWLLEDGATADRPCHRCS